MITAPGFVKPIPFVTGPLSAFQNLAEQGNRLKTLVGVLSH
jgi:hypothetical protein